MDLRKLLSPDRLFSALCSKGRVISGFGLGVLASLMVFSLMFSVGGNRGPATVGSSSPSLLSWFFSVPGNGSSKEPPETWVPQRGDGLAVGSPHEPNSAVGTSSGSNPRGKAAGQEEAVLEILSGDRGNASGKAGVEERSYANGTGASSYLDGTNAGKPSGNHTIESSVLKQGESSCDGEFAVLGNGSTSLKADSTEKSHEKSSSANLTCTVSTGGGELTANLSTQDTNTSLPAVGGIEQKTDKTDSLDVGKDNITGSREASESRDAVDAYKGSGSIRMKSGLPAKCDIFNGRWVRDDNKPYYPPGSCPHIDRDFNCHDNGRPDYDFLRWRWRPNDCDIPSLNATDFLTRLRGQRLIFVGDSLNRNMWESLVCILRHGVRDKNRVYEMSGRREFKTRGYYSFIFKDYNCSVDFVRSPFLVRELYASSVNGSEDERLRLDVMDATTSAYHEADIVVFNTGHWWTHEKTSRGINYYQEGEHVYSVLKVMEAYKKALSTWARWLDKNINPSKTQVVFRGYSLTHFSGGQWNSGGQCHKETEPIFNQSYVRKYPAKMRALEQVLKQMKTPVMYLNISSLTDYRKDGHPSIYRKKYKSVEEKINAEKSQDCSHWCLPGIPDTWNELLYASLLMVGRGSWRN